MNTTTSNAPLASLFPPMQTSMLGPTSTTTTSSSTGTGTASKDILDWTSLFAQAAANPTTTTTVHHQPAASNTIFNPAAFFAGSPEGFSAGSPASSRDFGSPLLDFELPFAADNEAALFPPDQASEVDDWMAKFNLFNTATTNGSTSAAASPAPNGSLLSGASALAPTSQSSSSQIDVAAFLRTAALLTAQQHSSLPSSQQSEMSAASQPSAIPALTFSQQQDQAIADVLANSTADLAASQQSLLSHPPSEDDFMPIRGPVHLPAGSAATAVSPAVSPAHSTVPDYISRLHNTSWSNHLASMSESVTSFSQQSSSAHTIGDSQHSSRGASPTPVSSPSAAVNSLATVFVREYARSHAVHDIDVLVRGLRTAGINIADDVLRDIVGPSPLSLGSPASQLGTSPSPQLMQATQTQQSIPLALNANFAMLMSGLGMASQAQSQAHTDTESQSQLSFSQASSVSSLSSLPNGQDPTSYGQPSQSQSTLSQAPSDDGWSSDASWSPYSAPITKTKVAQANQAQQRARSSVSTQHTTAKASILGSPAITTINTYAHTKTPSDGIMTTVWLPSGKRAFSCNVCHKLFDRAFNLRTHADTHKTLEEREKGKRFICPHNKGEADECGKPFARKHDCVRHWKTVHGKAIAGSSSAAAIGKLMVPQPIIKNSKHTHDSFSSGDEDELDDDADTVDHHTDNGDAHEEAPASTDGSSFG
ncbi:hypothetical protein OC842_006258 [Tilletia horrida]|uniref:C2H2-type domain-containing protein n=1 Tax=Tilletia horrida TaxID=155126 RepID=A0AAN6JI74_9BASI|nr:hypothetical protein OC842_006258 [Tilletia horrida]